MKIKRFAALTKRLHNHYAPSGFVTSFEIATDEVNFFGTHEEAEAYINEQTDLYQDVFWTIEIFYVSEPIVKT